MDDAEPLFTLADAERFAQRYGLTKLKSEDMPALAKGMDAICRGGRAIPRVASKFDPPAYGFTLPARLRRQPA